MVEDSPSLARIIGSGQIALGIVSTPSRLASQGERAQVAEFMDYIWMIREGYLQQFAAAVHISSALSEFGVLRDKIPDAIQELALFCKDDPHAAFGRGRKKSDPRRHLVALRFLQLWLELLVIRHDELERSALSADQLGKQLTQASLDTPWR